MFNADRLSYTGLQLGGYIGIIIALLSCSSLSEAEQVQSSISVSVELAGDDGLTQTLSSAIKKKVVADKRLAIRQPSEHPKFTISSETNVNWDTLLRKNIIIYHVKLLKGGHVYGDKVGACFEKQVEKCANDIVSQFALIMSTRG